MYTDPHLEHYLSYDRSPHPTDDASDEEMRRRNSTSRADHGERTNPKLKSQPFYQRGNNGKMKRY